MDKSGSLDLFPTMISVVNKPDVTNTLNDPERAFMVRGKSYLTEKSKIKHDTLSHYQLVGADLVFSDSQDQISNVGNCPLLSFKKARNRGFERFVFIVNFSLGFGNLVIYWTPRQNRTPSNSPLTGSETVNKVLQKFIGGSEEVKNDYFKIIPSVIKGNWILSKLVTEKPCILCRKISTNWYQDFSPSGNYIEANLNLNSNPMATGILRMTKKYVDSVVIDMAFLLEGKEEDQLPEEILFVVRLNRMTLDKGVHLDKLKMEEQKASLLVQSNDAKIHLNDVFDL